MNEYLSNETFIGFRGCISENSVLLMISLGVAIAKNGTVLGWEFDLSILLCVVQSRAPPGW